MFVLAKGDLTSNQLSKIHPHPPTDKILYEGIMNIPHGVVPFEDREVGHWDSPMASDKVFSSHAMDLLTHWDYSNGTNVFRQCLHPPCHGLTGTLFSIEVFRDHVSFLWCPVMCGVSYVWCPVMLGVLLCVVLGVLLCVVSCYARCPVMTLDV